MERYIETPQMGEILKEEFMDVYNVSAYRLAKDIHVPVSRIQEILIGKRKITVDTSLRLARYFSVSDMFFLNIQNDIDIRNAKREMRNDIDCIQPVCLDEQCNSVFG